MVTLLVTGDQQNGVVIDSQENQTLKATQVETQNNAPLVAVRAKPAGSVSAYIDSLTPLQQTALIKPLVLWCMELEKRIQRLEKGT